MKTLTYIMTLFWTMILFGCGKTEYADPKTLSVKTTGIEISNINEARPMSDGSIAVPLEANEQGNFVVAKIRRDGTVEVSDSISGIYNTSMVLDMAVNSSGECLFARISDYTVGSYVMAKLDAGGRQVFPDDEVVLGDYQAIITLLSDGSVAYFNSSFSENGTETPFIMKIIGNNFSYRISNTTPYNIVAAFDDLLVAYAQYSDDAQYLIFRPDGTVIGGGIFDCGIITSVQCIGGYLYFLVYDTDFNLDDGSYSSYYYVIKTDLSGNQKFCEKVESDQMTDNITVHDGKIITTGKVITDKEKYSGYGAVFVLDDNTGKLLSTIPLDYLGCDIIPFYVSPAPKGGYDVYAVRRESYDDISDTRSGFHAMNGGRLYIYHADNLLELDINN
ncbi:MAG: hypothetical protein IIU03_07675 [Bacteroidales bacterium]|nr:hypothetical protein [Bacteroidales bacterium]